MKSIPWITIAVIFLIVGCQSPEDRALEEFESQSDKMEEVAATYAGLGPCFRKLQRDREVGVALAMRKEGEERVLELEQLNTKYGLLLSQLDSVPLWREEFLQIRDQLVAQANVPFQTYDGIRKEEENMAWAWRVITQDGPNSADCEQSLAGHCRRAKDALAAAHRLAKK